ncbi:MAG: YfcE family phosphodiesterase [Pseudobutyrivibrio sp.]|nr:YfcE family phosphodiesterase [Pseudobutyrivibrio sp.]
MKILVVSDTHCRAENLRDAIEIEKPDRIFHLGDGQGVEDKIWMMSEVPLECVCGNCDWGADLPKDIVLEVGKHVVMLTHGHFYGVEYGYTKIAEAAKEKGCDVVLYGHTHVPTIDRYEDLIIANPGSISQPRQQSGEHTYMTIMVDNEGEFKMDLHSLEEYDRTHGN